MLAILEAPQPAGVVRATLRLQGIDRASPFAVEVRTRVGEWGHVEAGGTGRSNDRWARLVRGTSMQWWSNTGRSNASLGNASLGNASPIGADTMAGLADIHLDLHRRQASGGRSWCIVDDAGVPVLQAFHALDVCYRPPYVASLYLIESRDQGASWQRVADAHLSSAKPYRTLLDEIGRICAWLLRTGLRAAAGTPDLGLPWVARPPMPVRRNALARTKVASLAAWLRARLGGDLYGIAVLDRPTASFLCDGVVTVAEWSEIPARQGFIADPFFWPGRPGRVLCEIYGHATGLGRLAADTLRPGGIAEVEAVSLPIAGHLSYPFAWTEQDRVFCLPEMAASRRQLLFEIVAGQPPVEVCVIAEDVGMADPTLMRIDGLYWLAYSDTDIDPYNNLCLMHAPQLAGPWRPHPGNPVKVDARSSRPGGTPFRVGGRLYRPAQDCSRGYGGKLVINQVRVCTPTHYEEEAVAILKPDAAGRFPDGLHTLSFAGGLALIDGKRISYHPAILFHKLRRRVIARMVPSKAAAAPASGCQTLPESSGWLGPRTRTPAQ